MKKIILDGNTLTIQKVIEVATNHAKISIHPDAIKNVRASQAFIYQQVKEGKIVYGVTTGFGPNADKRIRTEDAEILQHNLIISHATGVGQPFSQTIVRAIMTIRINTLLAGHSGIRLNTIKLLVQFLNQGIHPYIPQQGSVGASGDLAPLCHMAITLIGVGKVFYKNKLYTLPELYDLADIKAKNQEIADFNTKNDFSEDDIDYQMPIVQRRLTHKESLAMINGTTVMNALGVIGVHKARLLLQGSTMSAGMFAEAISARSQAFDEVIHIVRRHAGQHTIAKHLLDYFKNSSLIGITPASIVASIPVEAFDIQDFSSFQPIVKERITLLQQANLDQLEGEINMLSSILDYQTAKEILQPKAIKQLMESLPQAFCNFLIKNLRPQNTPDWLSYERLLSIATKKITPQDSYSVRCTPQVFGASLEAVRHVAGVVENELNAVVDNPIIFMKGQVLHNGHKIERSRILSGGNFHGQPLALVLDYLKLAMAEIGNLLERQMAKLVDKGHNDGLPAFLVEDAGLNSGMMIMQYTAASLVSENKVLVHPASVDSIPTSANQEDHVSMGPIAGRQALEIINNVENVLALHLIVSKQALNMREKQLGSHLKVQLSDSSQKILTQLEALGIRYYDKDRYMHDDITSVKDGLSEIYDLTKPLF
jgi:histidine ammonia-lyase